MGNFQANRRMDLTIYFRENPVPLQIKNVRNMLTEGGLLRIITADDEVQWWPLSAIFNIRQDRRGDATDGINLEAAKQAAVRDAEPFAR